MTKHEEALAMARAVIAWWEEHRYATVDHGDGETDNVYDAAPECVVRAQAYIAKYA